MNCRNSHDLLGSLRLHGMDEVDACVISIRLALWDTFVIHFSTVRHSRAHVHYRDSIPTNAANNSRIKIGIKIHADRIILQKSRSTI